MYNITINLTEIYLLPDVIKFEETSNKQDQSPGMSRSNLGIETNLMSMITG